MITFHTNYGDITIELDHDKAPVTCQNFLQYAREGFYNNTIFHRVINNFMVQGGGLEANMLQKTTRDSIKNESDNGLSNVVGSVAMARTSDPHSASSQFFINVSDNLFLDKAKAQDGWGYCVFGKVSKGMAVVNQIKAVATGIRAGHRDVPIHDIIIETTDVLDED